METGSPAAAISAPKHGKDGPLPPLLLVLTMITGLVDAVSYLELGHVFVANMTGNIVFLGFAAAGAPGLSVPASLAAIGAFLAGALAGGRLAPIRSIRLRVCRRFLGRPAEPPRDHQARGIPSLSKPLG